MEDLFRRGATPLPRQLHNIARYSALTLARKATRAENSSLLIRLRFDVAATHVRITLLTGGGDAKLGHIVVADQSAFASRLPERCPRCDARNTVRVETTIKGQAVYLAWCCNTCSYLWRISDTERERRVGVADRRLLQRDDSQRRK
jgi:hypothetical protein